MSMTPEDEQELFDDLSSIYKLARNISDTKNKSLSKIRENSVRIQSILRRWKVTLHE